MAIPSVWERMQAPSLLQTDVTELISIAAAGAGQSDRESRRANRGNPEVGPGGQRSGDTDGHGAVSRGKSEGAARRIPTPHRDLPPRIVPGHARRTRTAGRQDRSITGHRDFAGDMQGRSGVHDAEADTDIAIGCNEHRNRIAVGKKS